MLRSLNIVSPLQILTETFPLLHSLDLSLPSYRFYAARWRYEDQLNINRTLFALATNRNGEALSCRQRGFR
jgi:hypothetical protein